MLWFLPDKMNSPLEEKFKNSATKIQEFDQNNQPVQYRKLSIDGFEKDIYVTLPNDDSTHFYASLYEFKTCDVVGDIMKLCFND